MSVSDWYPACCWRGNSSSSTYTCDDGEQVLKKEAFEQLGHGVTPQCNGDDTDDSHGDGHGGHLGPPIISPVIPHRALL